jgi:actin-related protein
VTLKLIHILLNVIILIGLFKFISDYLPYFEKINIFFNIIAKKVASTIIFQELKSEIEDLETLRDEYVKRNTEQVSILIS